MMNPWRKTFLLLAAFAVGLTSLQAADGDAEVDARKVALDLAGAFSNDGFKIRDGHWTGQAKANEPAVVAVNLYAGNQYWFSVGANQAKKVSVHVYDENGQPMTAEAYEDDEKAAAGFSPTVSGQYFVSITPAEGDSGTFCLVYSYK
jgi:uncharacterized protein YfiM (DUF2279 family)